MKHPAKYTDKFLPVFAELLKGRENVLDPMAGTGKIAEIRKFGYSGRITCNDIEPEWQVGEKYQIDEWHFTDAANMDWAEDGQFDAICTSPTYGNRMADSFIARDGSKRVTYRHFLGHDLKAENTGHMHFGERSRDKHLAIWRECKRVLAHDGLLIVNVSNHIRKGAVIDVVNFHKGAIRNMGLTLKDEILIETPRMGFGANANLRVQNESILVFVKDGK